MRRGIGAVRRAGTSGDGQAPHSPTLSHGVGFPIARRQQQRAPPAAPSRHRSAPLRTSSSSNGDGRGSSASETGRFGRGGTSSCCALPPSVDTGQDVKQLQQLCHARAPPLEQQPQQHNAKTSTMDQRDVDDVARTSLDFSRPHSPPTDALSIEAQTRSDIHALTLLLVGSLYWKTLESTTK